MSVISASLVKELREKTGVGMMDCKKALAETGGDFEQAVDLLRKKGYAAASKKAGRSTSEGVVTLAAKGNKAVIFEINSETDFVARSEKFQNLVAKLIPIALKCNSMADFENAKYDAKATVKEAIVELVAVVGENINMRRFASLTVKNGIVGHYVHNSLMDNAGKIGVLVAVEIDKGEVSAEKLQDFAKKISMHVAAAKPECLSVDDVNADKLQKEREIFIEQTKSSGKPDNIIEKMVEGRIRKYYEEVVLLSQNFVMDNKQKISDYVTAFSKENNAEVRLASFVRYELGEEIS